MALAVGAAPRASGVTDGDAHRAPGRRRRPGARAHRDRAGAAAAHGGGTGTARLPCWRWGPRRQPRARAPRQPRGCLVVAGRVRHRAAQRRLEAAARRALGFGRGGQRLHRRQLARLGRHAERRQRAPVARRRREARGALQPRAALQTRVAAQLPCRRRAPGGMRRAALVGAGAGSAHRLGVVQLGGGGERREVPLRTVRTEPFEAVAESFASLMGRANASSNGRPSPSRARRWHRALARRRSRGRRRLARRRRWARRGPRRRDTRRLFGPFPSASSPPSPRSRRRERARQAASTAGSSSGSAVLRGQGGDGGDAIRRAFVSPVSPVSLVGVTRATPSSLRVGGRRVTFTFVPASRFLRARLVVALVARVASRPRRASPAARAPGRTGASSRRGRAGSCPLRPRAGPRLRAAACA